MSDDLDLLTIAAATCVAGYIALALSYVANADLGFSCEQIRSGALFAATLIAVSIAIDFFGKALKKAK